MTQQHDIERLLDQWFSDGPTRAPDRVLVAVADRIERRSQRPAWRLNWRFPVMNTTTRLILVGAALLIGIGAASVLLSGGGQPGPAPAPSSAPLASSTSVSSSQPSASASGDASVILPGEFTACLPHNSQLRSGTDEQLVVPHPDGDMTVERRRGYTWAGTITATDPRFSGTHFYSWDGDSYTLTSGAEGPTAYAEGHRIENAEGAWQGSANGATLPDGTSADSPVVLTGEGAYEGLTAVLFSVEGSCFADYRGLVMEFPDPPTPSTTE
jgi:hypothetical protein